MVIVFSGILLGLLALSRPLQRNSFYILHSAIVILSAYYFENHVYKVDPLNPKILLLFVVFHFISINLITILAYFVDKKAAQKGAWRVPEKNLHALEFLGGWIGALIGQKVFQHKNKKGSYQGAFWFLGVMQVCMVYLILKFLNML
ncbi:MAG: DUF1294 domain-containing protein [Lactobacillaceae bacterium]|nr:DUF1294 domain-containing protein [Lactobacillaceae bacterium]